MPEHIVKQGECVASIAVEYGFFWKTVWDHADNAALRQKRKTPNVLFEGDRILVPEKTAKKESGATEARHRFRRKGVPSKFRLQLSAYGQPRADLPFTFEADTGFTFQGKTDAKGNVSGSVPPGAKTGRLVLQGPDGPEEYAVNLGHLDPVDEVVGVQERLANLGLACEPTGELDERTKLALKEFQARAGLKCTGDLDATTRDKLVEMHGS